MNDMSEYYKREAEVKQQEEESGVYTIDVLSGKPHMRHRAVKMGFHWMRTLCGRNVANYTFTGLTGEFYADGARYARKCPKCFGEEAE